ncbi:MAG: PAS domain S-box protein [Janthinobacterium lividum]
MELTPTAQPIPATPGGTTADLYHSLFHAMDQGFCVLEIIFDEAGQQAVDFRYLELNPMFARQSGMPADALGKTARALVPDLEQFWFDTYGQVVRTGAPVRVEHYVPPLGRWFDVHAFRVGAPEARQVAVLFSDITARKHAEETLRTSEERQAFLLHLSDALRPATDASEIQATAARLLGQHLGVDRVYYVDISQANQEFVMAHDWHRPGTPSHARRYPLGAWPMPWLLGGQPWVCHDVDTDPTLPDEQRANYRANAIRAAVVVPLLRQGQLAATLVANQNTPRAWTPLEVTLVEETLGRTWAAVERTRAEAALARSEEKYRFLFDSIDEGFTTIEVLFNDAGQAIDYRYLELNQAHERMSGLPRTVVGKRMRELMPDIEEIVLQRLANVVQTGEPNRYEQYVEGLGRWFDVYLSRVGGSGSHTVASVFNDITARKRREQNLAFLAALNVDFAPLLSTGQIMAYVNKQLAEYLHLSRCHLTRVGPDADHMEVIFDWRREPGRLPSLLGTHRTADYLTPAGRQHLCTGRPLALNTHEPNPLISAPLGALAELGFGSSIDIPHLRDGHWRFLLTVARAEPGPWRPDEVELLQQLAARIYARLERAQAESALQRAHTQLIGVLENTHDAFYSLDAQSQFTYVNKRAAQLWGRDVAALSGQACWQVFPQAVGSESFRQHQVVLQTREPVHFETISPVLNGWIEVSIYPSQDGGLSIFFRDISGRKQAEEQQAFRLQLSDALRPLADPVQLQCVALRLLGEHLQLDRCGYADIQADGESATINQHYHVPGVAPFAGTHRLDSFGAGTLAAMRRGETLVVADVATDLANAGPEVARVYASSEVRAFIAAPLVKQNRLIAVLFVHHRTPRRWTPAEVALVEETAERTWAAVEQATAEAARRTSEATLAAVFEALPVGVGLTDIHGRLTLANHQMQQYVPNGIMPSLDDTQHLRWRAYDPEGHLVPRTEFPGARARRGERVLPGLEMCYAPENGPEVWTKVIAVPLPDHAGHLTVIIDIDAQKRTEQALRNSEEQFRLFLTTSADTLYKMSPNWRQMLTLKGKNFLADTHDPAMTWVEKYIPQEDQVATWAAIDAAIASQQTFELEHRVLRADGSVGWAASRAVPVFDAQGTIVEWFGAATDITARKQSAEALRLSEARLSLALQAGRMGSFEWTSEGNRISLSPMSEEVLGLLPNAAFTTSDAGYALLHPDDQARHQAIFEEAGRSGEDFHSIYRIVRPLDGAVRWIEERGQGTHDPATSGVCLRGVHWDVTEAMLTQQRLAELSAKLEQRVARRTRELQASRDLLQSVFDTSLLAISVLQAVRDDTGAVRDFRLRLVSKELARETGRTDLVGKLYAQEYPGIRAAGIFDLMVQTIETGEPQGMEYYYPYEGFDRWFACQFVKLGDGVVATNLDISERKIAEQERLKNLRLLEQAEAVAGLGSWDYELATGTMRWSDGMYQLFGRPLGSAAAPAAYLDLVVADDHPRAAELVHRLATGTGDFEATLRLRIGAAVKTIRTRFVVLHDEQGQAVRVLGVDLDLTELQRLEHDNLRLRLRQQRALFEAVQAAQEAERKRIAESLHNGIGQILYATKLRLDRLHAPLIGTDPVLATARREADQLLREAIGQTRTLSHELVPMVLEEFGLAAALQDIGRKASVPPLHLHSHVALDPDAAPLAPTLQMALYRMAQELAQNIVKHARGATQASLELETMPGWVLLRAEDNGPGFARPAADSPGLGLRSIRNRVDLLGGQLEAGSTPAGGAYVRIRIPLSVSLPHDTPLFS